MRLLVSIHDVSPAWTSAVVALWELCQRYDVTPALLVVPNWHGAWPLQRHAGFTGWLETCKAAGSEIMMHGERHDEAGLQRNLRDQVRAFGRTDGEGEFLTLGRNAAYERIERGVILLRSLNLDPVGFVPPAWLAREETFCAVRDIGLDIAEDAATVRVNRGRGRVKAPAVRWSGRTNTRAHASAVIAASRWKLQRGNDVMRLALHPRDLEHPVTSSSVHREVDRWLSLRSVIRYAEL